MAGPPLIVIGASAGGIETLRQVIPQLPETIPAAIAIVVHRLAVADDERLPRVLAGGAKLPVMHAADGDRVVAGRISVAPAGVHLIVQDGRFALSAAPRENRSRPSIDVLFRSAAHNYGEAAIGVLLSGLLHDGVAGLAAIHERGGRVIVQDPADAPFADMPRSALAAVPVDEVLPTGRLARALARTAEEFAQRHVQPVPAHDPSGETPALHTGFICPDCGGVLNESSVGGVHVYTCRTGHRYSEPRLFLEQEESLENALWMAVRSLEERAELSDRLAVRMAERKRDASAEQMRRNGQRARERAAFIRRAAEDVRELLASAEDNRAAEEAGSG
jgi:two-component system chemotaxis response regulator CheB